MKTLIIIKPDDWHLHLREGPVLKNIIQFTSEYFGRAIVMPNTKNPITSINSAISYRKSIIEALPESSKFEPLMTIYLTDDTDKGELINGFKNNVFLQQNYILLMPQQIPVMELGKLKIYIRSLN